VIRLLLFALLMQLLFLAFAVLLGPRLGARVEALTLGFGPRLGALPVGTGKLEIRLIPLAASVSFAGMVSAPDEAPGGFPLLHPLARAGVLLGSWAGVALLSGLLLGPQEAARAFGRAFPEMVRALDVEQAKALWAGFLAQDTPHALGLYAAKVLALNLLPLPTLAGGQALATLLRWKRPPRAPGGLLGVAVALSMLVLLLMSVQWTRGLWAALSAR
jgi:membrane-associated protease RseP (regulator of RpoE activity)